MTVELKKNLIQQIIGFLILCFIIEPACVIGQVTKCDTSKFELSIVQNILPGDNWTINYIISKKNIKIYKTKEVYFGDKIIHKSKNLYDKKLDSNFIDSLNKIIHTITLYDLKDNYSSAVLDGINWTFIFKIGSYQKQVYLDNYYIPEIGKMLDYIDKYLPKNKRLISFDYFDIRKKFEKK